MIGNSNANEVNRFFTAESYTVAGIRRRSRYGQDTRPHSLTDGRVGLIARLFHPETNSMTQAEKKRLSAVLHATEFLFLENIALKLVLEHRAIPNWQKLVDHLLADKEMLGGVRLTF
jgi:hypothetical protein